MTAVNIVKKITGFSVLDKDSVAKPAVVTTLDVNPLDIRIDRRPEGELEATSTKFEYYTQEGKKHLYLLLSFMPISGVLNGEAVTVERPVEVFLPAGQSSEDHQWVMATMRNLSLAARAGFMAKALQDLRAVTWTKGPVRCGMKDYGNGVVKPIIHDSEVAAIAWTIQQALVRRGFLDSDGNPVPVGVLAKRYQAKHSNVVLDEPEITTSNDEVTAKAEVTYLEVPKGATCPECRVGVMIKQSGCEVCPDCNYSKC